MNDVEASGREMSMDERKEFDRMATSMRQQIGARWAARHRGIV